MLPHRSLLTIALGGFLLALFALPGAQAQSPTAPTPSIDPETIDAIWQRASNKYDNQRAALLKQVDAADHHGPFRPDWESLQKYEVPEWYKDAKFGIFIHWGVYSVPAFGNEWYPRNMYNADSDEYKHHIATYGMQDKFGYKDFIPMFKAADFNAAAWAQLFQKSGAKYVVPVAEHHDGFAMYDSGVSDWTAAKMGPHRDIIGELAGAVRAQGLHFGVSSHRVEHNFFLGVGRSIPSDVNDPQYAAFYGPAHPWLAAPWGTPVSNDFTYVSTAWADDWLARGAELVEKYHPDIVYFDWWIGQPSIRPNLTRFAAFYYNRSLEYTSISNKSWGYIRDDTFKLPEFVVHQLIDIVSKNGKLLLNIGPKSDGTIPDEVQKVLLDVGAWLKVNGEAIYGTRAWRIYGEGPTKVASGSFHDTDTAHYTPEDFRFTTKGEALYVIGLGWPANAQAVIHALAQATGSEHVQSVALLGSDAKLQFEQSGDGLHVRLPAQAPTKYAYALRVTFGPASH